MYGVLNRFWIRATLSVITLAAVLGSLTQMNSSLRLVAPTMSFVLVAGLAQMLFGKLPRAAYALGGAILFPLSALIDPFFAGRLRLQWLEPIEYPWLIAAGTISGYLGGMLLRGLFLAADRLNVSRTQLVYAVPRRFGTGTLLVATTLFAMLFAFLQWAHARPEELFFYTAFVATVSVAQMVFERSPRWASILAGGFYLPLSMFVIPLIRGRGVWRGTSSINAVQWILIGLFIGYLGGALVAGIFLASDFILKLIHRHQPKSPSPAFEQVVEAGCVANSEPSLPTNAESGVLPSASMIKRPHRIPESKVV